MIKKIALVLLILLFSKVNAQNSSLNGVVTDSLQAPLAYANVIVKPQNTSINMSFAITDEQGRYKLELIKNEQYAVSVSFIGYQSQSFQLKISENTSKNMVLKQASELLNEVVIIQQLPVEVKEDTITYRTKAFVTGEERKLKAVLNKLPGVDVDENGLVTVQGKKVTHMLVEGKKFFGGGSKLAVENIPANAVGEVEVIDNYSEISMLKGLEETDDMAMNIKLKKDKKQFTFGDVEAGKGNDDFYAAHAGLFYYSPKTRVNFIGDLNNTGDKFFTLSDYVRFEGGVDKALSKSGSMYDTSDSDFSAFMDFEDVAKSTNKFAALNLSTPISNTTEISGYALFSNTNTTLLNNRITQYLFEDNTYTEQLDEQEDNNNNLAIAKINLEHKPTLNSEWHFNSQLKYNNVNSESANKLLIDVDETNFKLDATTSGLVFKQSAEWYKKYNKIHTTSLIINYKYDDNNPESNWFTGDVTSNEDYNIFQKIKSKSSQLDAIFKHFWRVGSKSQLQTVVGNYYFNETYATNVFQENTDSSFDGMDLENVLDYTLNDVFLGVNYKFKQKKIIIEAGGYIHNYDWNILQANSVNTNKFSFLPNFSAKYSFYKSEKLHFTYAIKNQFLKTAQLVDNYTLLNYNTFFKGNPNLEFINYHTARLLYTKFNLYKNIILSGSVGFNKKKEVVNNEIKVVETNKYLTPILLEYPNVNWNFRADLYKRYGVFKLRFTGRFDISDYGQLIDDQLSVNQNYTQYYKTSIATNFDKAPNVKIGYNLKLSEYKSTAASNYYVTHEPFIEFDYVFLNGFIFKADYYSNTFKNITSSQKDNYKLANASLFYQKEGSAWGFEISGDNLFNIEYKLSNVMNDFFITDTKNYIIPRVYMFTVTYKL